MITTHCYGSCTFSQRNILNIFHKGKKTTEIMVASRNTTGYDDYDDSVGIPSQSPVIYDMYQMKAGFRYMYVSVYSANILLGLLLNSAVIFMTVKCRSKKKLSQHMIILGLAVTHLVFCLFAPLYLITAWNYFSWTFGKVVCKLGSYVMFMNMFSVSLMITFWNVCWSVPGCFEHRMSTNMVLLSWFIGAILSTPSLLSREVQYTADGHVCLDNYGYTGSSQMSKEGRERLMAVLICRFIFGLLLPLGVRCVSCCCMNSMGNNQLRSRVIRPVTIAHFLCWTPVISLSVLQATMGTGSRLFTYALPPATALSVLNSCISPIICIWQEKKEQSLRGPPQMEDNRDKDEEMTSLTR
ncbi:chemerin-like receptor 1 [Salvelinus alpinus]|uniref:chemerin-like receptor 1 n=1 Tax=Salvelinus alpinus TaxID=8036 RepID=UPI0039FBBB7D